MKINLKYGLLLAALVGVQVAAAAGGRASEILTRLSERVRTMGNYGVAFSVQAGDNATAGAYTVGGESYYMNMGDAEVYCDGGVRYEVNNRTKEVVIDKVDASSRNILNNPTHAFDLVGGEFTAELLWERGTTAAVKLTPKAGQSAMSTMTVTLDTQQLRPVSLEYDFDGDRIEIKVQRFAAEKAAPKAFNRADYRTYEFIDFR